MSRSTRRPYAYYYYYTDSVKRYKVRAHRGQRRKQNQALRHARDYEDLLLPHKLECPGNDIYEWKMDGRQFLHFPPTRGWRLFISGDPQSERFEEEWFQREVREYKKLKRK